ncbi:hypothetical protein DFH09DRAFT_7262 [Mycena vulgaris]|nr:hypothetical protein DFH09DRAFT_7262 [Mycena vulgaris]
MEPSGEHSDSDSSESSVPIKEDLDSSDPALLDDNDETAETALAVEAALGSDRYARRTIEQQLAVFVEYIVRLRYDPKFSSKAAKDHELPYRTALTALRQHLNGYANSICLQTWNPPFVATLDLRPSLNTEFVTPVPFPRKPRKGEDDYHDDEEYGCQACWTRGNESCDWGGRYSISTEPGTYNRNADTFKVSFDS